MVETTEPAEETTADDGPPAHAPPAIPSPWATAGKAFPDWTGTVVVGWFPASLLLLALVSAVADQRTSLVALTLLVLGFFLVASAWLLTGGSERSLLGAALVAILLTAACLVLLLGVAHLGSQLDDPDGRSVGSGHAAVSQEQIDKASLSEADLRGSDLSGRDFSVRDLDEIALDGSLAVRATFTRAWLADASLRGADLTKADFTGACLKNADLRGARLLGASFDDADVTGAEFDEREVRRAESWPSPDESTASTACQTSSRPRD